MKTPNGTESERLWLDRWGGGILVAAALLLFVRSLAPDLTMAQGDTSVVGTRWVYDSLPYGVIARWEPLQGMGMPGTALALTPSTLLGWLVPYGKSTDVNYLFHIIVFGLGGWFLLKDITRSAAAALVGGVWFMLQPHAFSHMQPGHGGYFWTCAWMPWCLYFLRLAVRRGHVGLWILAGASGGLTLTGQPDVGVIFLLFVFAYGVFLIVREGISAVASGGKTWRYAAGVVAKGIAAGAACVLMGFQILVGSYMAFGRDESKPPAAVETKSAADQAREKWFWATQWSVPVEESLDFFLPGLFGWGSSHPTNPYRGRVGQTEGYPTHRQGLPNLNDVSNYLGAFIVLGCVVAVAARRKNAEVWFLFGVALVSCLFAFGKHAPFYRMFYELPFMSSIRNPIKWFAVTSLCVGILGSIGVAEALSRETVLTRLSPVKRLALCFVPGVVVVTACVMFLSRAGSGSQWLFWHDTRTLAAAWDSVRAGGLFWGLAGGLFLWAMRDRAKGTVAKIGRSAVDRFFPAAAGLVVLVEVLNVDLRYMPYNNADIGIRSDAMVEFMNSQKRPFRILLTRMDGAYRFINDVLCQYHGWETPGITVSRTEDASAIFMRGLGGNPKKMLQLANVHYLLSPNRIGDPDFVPVVSVKYGNMPVIVHRFTNALPRYYVVGQWEVVPEDKALDLMATPEFDPRRTALIHEKTEAVSASSTEPVAASCEIIKYSREGATMRTMASRPAVLVGLERYDTSWAVFVDGKPAPMWKADWMLRACPIPAGEHFVEWRLVGDAGFGFWMGIAGWLVVVLAAGWVAAGRSMAKHSA